MNLRKCLQALLLPPADYYAMRLRKAFVGLGTSDRVVVRVLGGHDKPDVLAIAAAFIDVCGVAVVRGAGPWPCAPSLRSGRAAVRCRAACACVCCRQSAVCRP